MGQIEIFPAVQVASSGTVVATEAASSLLALNDSSDSSYIVNSGASRASRGYMLDDFSGSLPAGAVVQSVQMRFRYSHANRPNPSPYEILKPVTVLIGRQVPIGGGAFKYVYDGYHGGQQMLDWVASTGITEATFHPREQTYAGEYYADIYARGGRRLFVSLELLADSILNVSRMYSISVLVNYNELPVVAVVDPTGTYTVSRPTITWTYSDPDGDSQTLFQVKIFTDDQVAAAGFNVDTSEALYDVSRWSSVMQHTPESSFYAGDGVYRVYVRAAHSNIGNQQMWSAWDFNDFTLDLEEPQYPVILAEHDTSMNAVVVEFQSHDNMLDWNQSSGELTTTAGVTGDTNTTVTNTSAQASHGVRSFQYTRTGSTGTAAFRTTAGLGGVAVHEGDLYIALVDVRTQTTARSVSVGISWYDAAGALLSTSTGVASNDASGAWGQRYVIAKAPVGAMTAAVVVSAASVAVSENHYADKLSILRAHHHVFPQETAADLALWQAGTNTTLAISTAQRFDGDASMSMTRTTSTGTASGHTFPGLFGIPAVAGEVYEATAQFRANTTGRVCSIVFRFYDISQVILSATQTQVSPTDLATGWVEASVSAIAPANTVWVEIDVAAAGCAVSEVHYVDRITLTHYASRTWARGGFLNETSVMVRERSIDLGVTWQVFRDSISMDGHIEHIDGEIPSAAEVWYRAKVEADNQDGEPMTSVYSPVERITVPVYTAWWLRDPLNMPDSNMIVRVKSSVAERPKPQSVGYPLEGSTAVVSHDGVKGRIWSLEIDLLNEGDYATFWQMIESGHTLVIQDTLGRQVYAQAGETTREEMMRAYKTPFEQWPIRHAHTVELTFIEVERASG